VGILSTDDENENEWIIPPSRTENHITEDNSKNNSIPNNNVDNFRPGNTENITESWIEIIPTKIKNGIDTVTSELKQFINGTQHITDQLENVRIIFVKTFKRLLNIPMSDDPKVPKR
jgi:hypothetical protein